MNFFNFMVGTTFSYRTFILDEHRLLINVLPRRIILYRVRYFLMRLKASSLYWAVLHKFSICFLKISLLQIVIPKSITSLIFLTVIEFVTIFRFSVINCNFHALAFNEFVLNQNKIFFIWNMRFLLMCNNFLSHEYKVLSSAKLHISGFSIKKNISIMNVWNSSGPNIDPWGIPQKPQANTDPILILCFLQLR